MENQLVNRVSESALISLDLSEFIQAGERVSLDLKEFLYQEFVLREKEFRAALKEINWNIYQDKFVAIDCSADAIVPTWAYMLLVTHLSPVAKGIVKGTIRDLEKQLFVDALDKKDWSAYKDAKVVMKGCSELHDPEFSFAEATKRLIPWVSSLMYGEPCSTVPVFKKKIKNI